MWELAARELRDEPGFTARLLRHARPSEERMSWLHRRWNTFRRERSSDVDIALWADGLIRNVRYAVRTLARTPGFTAAVVLTLALGANTAVFSAINAVLLQPLPFPDGDRLMQLRQRQERTAETNIAPVRLEDWHRLNSTFEAITGHLIENVGKVALSVTLLAGAGLLVRSFQELSRVNPGFESRGGLTFHMSGSWAEMAERGRLVQRIERTLEALRALPGVEAAATAIFLPGVLAHYELVQAVRLKMKELEPARAVYDIAPSGRTDR